MKLKDLLGREMQSRELAWNLILQQIIDFCLSRIYDLNTDSNIELQVKKEEAIFKRIEKDSTTCSSSYSCSKWFIDYCWKRQSRKRRTTFKLNQFHFKKERIKFWMLITPVYFFCIFRILFGRYGQSKK